MLNGTQNGIFRPLVDKAWKAYCGRTAGADLTDKAAKKVWYRKVLQDKFCVASTNDLTPPGVVISVPVFDELCLHFATISCDAEQIGYWSTADERRALWRLERNMKQAGLDWPYVRGIAKAMHLLDSNHSEIRDLPAKHILKLATALFLYMKRKDRKASRTRQEEVPF